jgi:hypothetical protein
LKIRLCLLAHLLVDILYSCCRALVEVNIMGWYKRYERVIEVGEAVSGDVESELGRFTALV